MSDHSRVFITRGLFLVWWIKLTWENSWHLATPSLVSPWKDVWETSAEIPYWWPVTIQIWVVFLIGWSKFPVQHVQSETLPRSGQWRVISMEFLHLFFRHHFAGKLVVGSRNVCYFLRIDYDLHFTNLWFPVINFFFPFVVWSLHLSFANFLEVERLVLWLSTDVKRKCEELILSLSCSLPCWVNLKSVCCFLGLIMVNSWYDRLISMGER